MSANEYELSSCPSDGISSIRFSPTSNLLLVSSWDSSVRLYDVEENTPKASYSHKAAVLDCCFSEENRCFSGGVDKSVKMHEFNTSKQSTLGHHDKGVRCIEFASNYGLVVSGSWDSTMKFWDPRASSPCVATVPQPDRVYTMSHADNRVVVGTANRHVYVWDIRSFSEPEQRRESSLKYQTRCIRTFPDNQGYVLSSIEGRVAIEYFDVSPEVQARKYAFKCHRTSTNGTDTVYPVNAIAFHPTFGTFASGGCDGIVNIWDGQNKKRLCQFHKYPTSISSLAFSADGSLLAIASSYTFEEGEKDHPADKIFIRKISETEVKPKPKVAA